MSYDSILTDLLGVPQALRNCLKYYLSQEGKQKLKLVNDYVENSFIKRVIFIGHSYNYFASMIPFRYLNSRYQSQSANLRKICIRYEIDEFLSYFNPRPSDSETLFIFISRSGDSTQIKQGIKKLKGIINDENIWGVTNDLGSYLGKNCHFTFPIISEIEEIMGTKSYVNTMFVLYLISRSLIGKEGIPPNREDEVRNLIFEMKFYSDDWERHTQNITDFLGKDFNYLYFISTGASLSTAQQASLSCKAFARTYGEAISLGLFLHGPFQIIDDSFRCVLIIGDETSLDNVLRLINLITERLGTGKVILINNSRRLSSLGRGNEHVFVFEHTTENTSLAPLFEIIVLQYLFLQRAKLMGVIE